MHRIDQAKPLLHAALANQSLDGVRDVYEAAPAGHFKPKLFRE